VKKKIYLVIFLFFLGCSNIPKNTEFAQCPNVLFSAQHINYFDSGPENYDLDNINYKAKINNYSFDSECFKNNNSLRFNLSLLFIVRPEFASENNISLPFYIALLDTSDKLIKIQYFMANEKLNKDDEKNKFIETEVIQSLNIEFLLEEDQLKNYKTLIIGFMLEKRKLELLN